MLLGVGTLVPEYTGVGRNFAANSLLSLLVPYLFPVPLIVRHPVIADADRKSLALSVV